MRDAAWSVRRGTCRWVPSLGVGLWFGLVFALGACRGTRVGDSDWPPDDFCLEVRARAQTKEGLFERQSLHVFADGLVVYREVDLEDAFPAGWPPVFSRVCAYRMLPQSTRSLARGLYQAGLFQIETVVGTDADAEDVIAIALRAFGEQRRLVARGRVYGSVIDVLHVVNAYVPPGCALALPDMTGEPQPPRLSQVPQPVRDVAGAYRLHREWAARLPAMDVQWRIELFALAVRAGDLPMARDVLAALERDQAANAGPFPDVDGVAKDMLARLRGLLP